MHIYEGGQNVMFESAMLLDTTSVPTLRSDDNIVYESSAVNTSGERHDALHHSSTPVLGLGAQEAPHGRQLDDARGHAASGSAPRRLQSTLNTLPTGPPYGRLSSCQSAPAFVTNTIGVVVDWGFASVVGGTLSAVNAELASIIQSTNAIYNDQVGHSTSRNSDGYLAVTWLSPGCYTTVI